MFVYVCLCVWLTIRHVRPVGSCVSSATPSAMESSVLVAAMVIHLAVFIGRCQGNSATQAALSGPAAAAAAAGGDSFFPEWGLGGGRSAQPTCVDIPRNLSLCYGIRYSKMRLPNLLDHDSMAEVIQQAASWVPLLNVRCHADTQLFLCSLFRCSSCLSFSSFSFFNRHVTFVFIIVFI